MCHLVEVSFQVCFLCVQVRSRDQLILQLRDEMKTAEQKYQATQEQVLWFVCVCQVFRLFYFSCPLPLVSDYLVCNLSVCSGVCVCIKMLKILLNKQK